MLPDLSPLKRAVLVMLALAALASTTAALAGYYHETKERYAQERFAEGRRLLAEEQREAAIVELRAALSLDRTNPEYALVLATALLEAGHPQEAQTHLDDAMRADPTSGPANLIRAEVARALGEERTDVYYQRAFFGSWPPEALDRRIEAGFDLATYLLDRDQRERARATLTQLAAETGTDPVRALRIARLLLEAGAPDDAVPLARVATDADRDNAATWGVLAEAAFASNDDQTALQAATRAGRLDRDNTRWPYIVYVLTKVQAMDPTRPRLRAAERQRRSRVLLELILADADECEPPPEGAVEAPTSSRAQARALLERRDISRVDTETILDLALRLWEQRPDACPAEGADMNALARVLERLTPAAGEP